MKDSVTLAVIGGSGLYAMEGMNGAREVKIRTPFGNPSDAIVLGTLDGVRAAFLPRHGRGHRINPSEVNHRANIYALKTLGVEQIIAVSACGVSKKKCGLAIWFSPTSCSVTPKAGRLLFRKRNRRPRRRRQSLLSRTFQPKTLRKTGGRVRIWELISLEGNLMSASKGRSSRPKRSRRCTGQWDFP